MPRQSTTSRFNKAAGWAGFSPELHATNNHAPLAVKLRALAIWKAYGYGDVQHNTIAEACGISDKLATKCLRRLRRYPGGRQARRYTKLDTITSEQAERLFALLIRETP